MSKTELLDILDYDGNVIGTITRGEAERDNHITANVLVFIFNSDGKVWTQLRPKNKNHYPGRWDISACGGLLTGETPEDAALRETKEETGLDLELTYTETFLNVFPGDDGEERKRLSHIYIGITNKEPQITDEVDEFKLWDTDELKAAIKSSPNQFVPSFLAELNKALNANNPESPKQLRVST